MVLLDIRPCFEELRDSTFRAEELNDHKTILLLVFIVVRPPI